jgi:RND family efflux transporter MFP subunit
LATAQANLNLAEITKNRYDGLLKTDSVSKQDADNAEGAYAAQMATVQASEANVKRLEELQSFEKVYAPFTGVITARNTDIGALIDSGSSGGSRTELFHIAQPDVLRVYVSVPEVYSQDARPGMAADLVLSEFPGKRFQGELVRTADAIDQTTRTLLVEIRVKNPTGTLLSGAYAEIHLKLPTPTSTFIIPVNTLLFRSEGLRIAEVGEGQRAELKQLTLGRDYGSEVEVTSGLTGNESIITNPPDSIVDGEQVRIAQPSDGGPGANQSGGANK